MFRTTRHVLRLCRIVWTLARHDALFFLEALNASPLLTAPLRWIGRSKKELPPGVRLANALIALGPAFIKLGQALSTRADMIGNRIALDLAELQDNLPPFPSHKATEIIEGDFEKPLGELFSHFEETPVAAASIAQVHQAITPDGRKVAVKIVRPNVEKAFRRDIALFYWIAGLLIRFFPAARRLRPVEVVQILDATVKMEMDMRYEAASASEVRENTKDDACFHVPSVDWERTSHNVLTLEWVEGIPISEVEALKAAGHDLNEVLRHASETFFNQVFRDGFFHADLHPGNLFVAPDGTLVAVDYGIMGRLDHQSRIYLAEMLQGFLNRDYRKVAEIHFAAGYIPQKESLEQFTLALRAIAEPILDKPLNQISVARLLTHMFRVTSQFHMETQPQLLLLQKTMMMSEGVGRMLNPDINMWQLAEPLIYEWAEENFGLRARMRQFSEDSLVIARHLPAILKKAEHALETLNEEGLTIHPESIRQLMEARRRQQRPWIILGWISALALILLLSYLLIAPNS